MNFYLLIPFFVILILFIPIKVHARFSFNLLDMSGALGLFLYKIKLTHQLIWLEHKKIFTMKDNEIERKEFDFESKEAIFFQKLIGEIKDKVRLKELTVNYNLGVGDAFESAMIGGSINAVLLSVMSVIKNSKPTASLGVYDTISYNREVCQFALKTTMSITLFDIVYSLLVSVILTKKTISEKKKIKAEKPKEPEKAKRSKI